MKSNADYIQEAKENYPNTDVTIRLTEDEARAYMSAIDAHLDLVDPYRQVKYEDGQAMSDLQTLFESITAGFGSSN